MKYVNYFAGKSKSNANCKRNLNKSNNINLQDSKRETKYIQCLNKIKNCKTKLNDVTTYLNNKEKAKKGLLTEKDINSEISKNDEAYLESNDYLTNDKLDDKIEVIKNKNNQFQKLLEGIHEKEQTLGLYEFQINDINDKLLKIINPEFT